MNGCVRGGGGGGVAPSSLLSFSTSSNSPVYLSARQRAAGAGQQVAAPVPVGGERAECMGRRWSLWRLTKGSRRGRLQPGPLTSFHHWQRRCGGGAPQHCSLRLWRTEGAPGEHAVRPRQTSSEESVKQLAAGPVQCETRGTIGRTIEDPTSGPTDRTKHHRISDAA